MIFTKLYTFVYILIFISLNDAFSTDEPRGNEQTKIIPKGASLKKILNGYLQNIFNKMKSSPGVYNNNACVWKICSKPLKNRNKTKQQPLKKLMIKNSDGNYSLI